MIPRTFTDFDTLSVLQDVRITGSTMDIVTLRVTLRIVGGTEETVWTEMVRTRDRRTAEGLAVVMGAIKEEKIDTVLRGVPSLGSGTKCVTTPVRMRDVPLMEETVAWT